MQLAPENEKYQSQLLAHPDAWIKGVVAAFEAELGCYEQRSREWAIGRVLG